MSISIYRNEYIIKKKRNILINLESKLKGFLPDFHQCLSTPDVKTQKVFYKRQL